MDIDIPEITKYHERYHKKSNKKYVHLQTILTKMIITHSYKWDTPKVQQQQPKLLQLTLIQAAGELYKIK
jgi:hypothetical protein